MTLPVCPCGKIIDSGPTCKSCGPAYRAGMLRIEEIVKNLRLPGMAQVIYAIRKEAG